MNRDEYLRAFARARTRPPTPVKPPIRDEVPASSGATTAVLRLYEPIDPYGGEWGVSAKEFASALDALPDTVTDLQLHISSPGGDVFEGLAMLNLLRQHPAAVTVTVDGLAASAASFVMMAGTRIRIAENAEVMLHDAFGLVVGNAAEMRDMAANLDRVSDNIAAAYATRGGTPEQWREVMRTETWYSAQEAVDAGLADEVLTADPPPEASTVRNLFDLSVFAYAGRRQAPAPTPLPALEEDDMPDQQLLAGLRQRLGVTDVNADTPTILAALDQVLEEQALPDRLPPPQAVPAAVQAELDSLRAQVTNRRRDEKLQDAVRAGKITQAERLGWQARWDTNPTATEHALATLPAGSRVPVTVLGHDGEPEPAPEDRLYAAMFGGQK